MPDALPPPPTRVLLLCFMDSRRLCLLPLPSLPLPPVVGRTQDVKQIAVWTSPHFTESVKTDADVRAIPDGGWLFWSKDSADEEAIPRRGVKLDGSHIAKKKDEAPSASRSDWASDQTLQDTAIRLSRYK